MKKNLTAVHNLLGHMEVTIAEQNNQGYSPDRHNVLVELNDRLVSYLRDMSVKKDDTLRNPTPEWDRFPLARSWFSQNSATPRKVLVTLEQTA